MPIDNVIAFYCNVTEGIRQSGKASDLRAGALV
jgi:hypothetical protein